MDGNQHIAEDGKLHTLTQLCREFDVTPRALRFYESKGLLQPVRVGTRRRFSQRDRTRLSLILQGKRFGFSLNEIGELLDLYDVDRSQVTQMQATLEVARRRLNEMRAQRDELTEAIAELESRIATGESDLRKRLPLDRAESSNKSRQGNTLQGGTHGTLQSTGA